MRSLFLGLALAIAVTAPAFAQDTAPKVVARLIADGPAAPGGSVTVALEEVIRPGWHTYWINPGDAGAPTAITWTLPAGWHAGPIQWPQPKRLPVGPLMDYGYEGKVWLLTKLTAPSYVTPGQSATLKAAVSWLVCKDICVPEDATLTLPISVGMGGPDQTVAGDFAAWRARLPSDSPWKATYALNHTLDLFLAAPALVAARPVSAAFFPDKPGFVKGAADQLLGFANDGLVLRLIPSDEAKPGAALSGVLVLTSSDGSVQALNISAPPGIVPAGDFPDGNGGLSLLLALAFAFLGGLILNVMPCVLPILAMKALAVARHARTEKHIAMKESFAYCAGAVLSFLAFGLTLVLLRAGGAAVGWGFQLQSPVAVAGFALLVFAVGLNLSGVFEFGSITAGEGLTHRAGLTGAFFTGVLAVAVAAPCTAPFMAAALGFALTQGAASALLIFFFLGLGFALPFLGLGLWPRALSFLPKPGGWMLRFKQALAFPMYAASAWLAWVLAQQVGTASLAVLFAAMVTLALAAWLFGATRDLAGRGRLTGTGATLFLLLLVLYSVAQVGMGSAAAASDVQTSSSAVAGGEPYSAARLADLRKAGRPVLVDATAAWCITCLVNEKAVLSRDSVKASFASRKVALLVADWTNQNPQITQLLTNNGRSGVPLYLYYAPGAATPAVLPQVLTENVVLDTIGVR